MISTRQAVLNPLFDIQGLPRVMVTQFLAAVPRRAMGTQVLDLHGHASVIVQAR